MNAKKEQRKGIGRGNNPNSRKNLKPSKPGMTNNPNGKRKGTLDRATVYRRFLEMKITVPDPADASKELKVSLYEAAALGQISAAAEGNTAAWKEIQDTLHGKIADVHEHTGAGGGAIETTTTVIVQGVPPKENDDE